MSRRQQLRRLEQPAHVRALDADRALCRGVARRQGGADADSASPTRRRGRRVLGAPPVPGTSAPLLRRLDPDRLRRLRRARPAADAAPQIVLVEARSDRGSRRWSRRSRGRARRRPLRDASTSRRASSRLDRGARSALARSRPRARRLVLRPRPEEPAQAVLLHPRHDVGVQMRHRLADDVVDRDERALRAHRVADREPRASGRCGSRARSARRGGRRASRGGRAGRAACGRGTPGGCRGTRARSRPRTRSRPASRRRRSRQKRQSGPLRQRPSARRGRRRARARRGRRCSRRRPGSGTGAARPSASVRDRRHAGLGDVVEVVDLAVARRRAGPRRAPGR